KEPRSASAARSIIALSPVDPARPATRNDRRSFTRVRVAPSSRFGYGRRQAASDDRRFLALLPPPATLALAGGQSMSRAVFKKTSGSRAPRVKVAGLVRLQ